MLRQRKGKEEMCPGVDRDESPGWKGPMVVNVSRLRAGWGWIQDAGPAASGPCCGLQSFDILELVVMGLQPLMTHRVNWR